MLIFGNFEDVKPLQYTGRQVLILEINKFRFYLECFYRQLHPHYCVFTDKSTPTIQWIIFTHYSKCFLSLFFKGEIWPKEWVVSPCKHKRTKLYLAPSFQWCNLFDYCKSTQCKKVLMTMYLSTVRGYNCSPLLILFYIFPIKPYNFFSQNISWIYFFANSNKMIMDYT